MISITHNGTVYANFEYETLVEMLGEEVVKNALKAQAKEQLISVQEAERKRLDDIAKDNIALLTDAIDLEMAQEGDKDKLKAWKQYRILLSRVELNNTESAQWPAMPK